MCCDMDPLGRSESMPSSFDEDDDDLMLYHIM